MAFERTKKCRGCGCEVAIIKSGGYYGRVLVETEPIWIELKTGGDLWLTADGRVVFGYQTGDANDDPDTNCIEAYIPHKGRCPNNGRAPRNRKPRPSGYR